MVGRKREAQSGDAVMRQLAQVTHNPERERFELWVAGDLVGVLGYSLDTTGAKPLLTVLHTVLYDEYTGHGLAKLLVRQVVGYCASIGGRMEAVCTFTQHYLAARPGEAAAVGYVKPAS